MLAPPEVSYKASEHSADATFDVYDIKRCYTGEDMGSLAA